MARPMQHFSIEQLQRAIEYMTRVAEARINAMIDAGPPSFNGEMAQYYAEAEYDSLNPENAPDYASLEFPAYDWCINTLFERVRDININALRKDMRQC